MNDHSHSVWEYEVEDDDVEDDDVKGEEDDELMLRRRKVMMLRMMMLRRKTDPKTGKHTLCEPGQSKRMSKFQKSHFIPNLQENSADQNRAADFVRACAVETRVKISQEPLYMEIYRKNAGAQSEHPDQAPAFTLTVRTPHCGHTLWGKTGFCRYLEMSELCNVFPLFQPPHRRFTRTQVIAMKAD